MNVKLDCAVVLVVLALTHAGWGWYAVALAYCVLSPWHWYLVRR